MASPSELVGQFLEVMAALPPFPHDKFSGRLFNKVRESSLINPFKDSISASDAESTYSSGKISTLDETDVSSLLDEMAAQSMARAIADLADESDQYGFRNCTNKANADDWFRDSIIRATPFLLAEHISWQIENSKYRLPPLRELRNNVDFVKTFYDKLLDQNFIRGTIMKDVVNHDHHYSTFLLFSLAYFESRLELDNIISGESIWTRQIGRVGAAWIVELIGILESDAGDVAQHIGHSFSPVFAGNDSGRLCICEHEELIRKLFMDNQPLTQTLAQNHPQSTEITVQIQNRLQTIQLGTLSQWSSIHDVLLEEWRNKSAEFVRAAQTYATRQREEVSTPLFGPVITTTFTGDEVAKLIDTGNTKYPKYFWKAAPKHSHFYAEPVPMLFNCLAPGTMIHTEAGSKAVEDIQEGDVLLARGNLMEYNRPATYGKVSNEERRIPVTGAILYGINGEDPFFTASHIFHTTTGLRAKDPDLAIRQNPTLAIGQLRPGHVLFRLDDQLKYSYVVIQSIGARKVPELDCIYNMHMSEERSYHANGYLVSVSYPEATPKGAAESLQNMTPYDRLQLLRKLPELQSIFQKHDSETLSSALDLEIKEEVQKRTARFYDAHFTPRDRLQLSDINRVYVTQTIHRAPSTQQENMPPQSIALKEGVVCIDHDKPLSQACISPSERSLAWTRQVADGRWEHGSLKLDHMGLSGRGAVFFTSEAETEPSSREEDEMNTIYFTVTSQMPALSRQKPAIFAQTPAIFMETPPVSPQKSEFSTMAVNRMVSSNLTKAPESQPPPSPTTDASDTSTDLCYALQYDSAVMVSNDPPTGSRLIQNPKEFGDIIIHLEQVGGPTGIQIPMVKVPFLDRLCDALNAAAPQLVSEAIAKLKEKITVNEDDYQSSKSLSSLYSSSVTQDEKGQMVANVRMADAAALAEMADFSNSLEKTFQAVTKESNVSVPLVFQELELTISSDFTTAYGVVYQWDQGYKGMMGDRHYLHSVSRQEELDTQMAAREVNATAAVNLISTDPTIPISTPQLPPSSAAKSMDPNMAVLDCGPLQNLDGYNEYSVSVVATIDDGELIRLQIHSTTQSMLQTVVRYHMAEEDRKNFLGTIRPIQLPKELAEDLDPTLKTWLGSTYNKAYISWIIAQGLDSDLDELQKNKLWYWWEGSGAGTKEKPTAACLKKTPQYAQLNQVVAAYATRQLFSKTLDPYIKSGGSTWAGKLAEVYTNDNAMNGLIHSLNTINGVNPVNKICNIMNALDPSGTQARTFYNKYVDHAMRFKVFSGPFIGNTDELRTYLNDAMNDLATRVLNDDQSLDPELRAGIHQDLEPLFTEKTNSVKTQVALLMDNVQYMTTLLVKQLGDIKAGYKAGLRVRDVAALVDSIEGTVHPDPSTNWPKTFKCLRNLAIAGLVGALIMLSTTTFLNWKQASDGQKVLAISAIMQTVSTTLRTIRYFKKNPIRDFNRFFPGQNPGGGRRGAVWIPLQLAEEMRAELGIRQPLNQALGGPDPLRPMEPSSKAPGIGEPEIGPLGPGPNRPAFNLGMTLLRCLDIFAGIGFVVGMSLELRDNYNNMDTFQATMAILQVVVQGLIVICDIATLGIQVAASLGYGTLEAAATACMTLATIGAVLGVIAIVAMLALIIYDLVKPKPLTEAQTFIKNNKDFINSLTPPPTTKLSYSISTDKVSVNSSSQIVITIKNSNEKAIVLRRINFQLSGGKIDTSLFQNKVMVVQDSSQKAVATASDPLAVIFTSGTSLNKTINLNSDSADGDFFFLTGNIGGPSETQGQPGDVTFAPEETCSITFSGYVSDRKGKVEISMAEDIYLGSTNVTDVTRKSFNVEKI